jgi:hypothetical protein
MFFLLSGERPESKHQVPYEVFDYSMIYKFKYTGYNDKAESFPLVVLSATFAARAERAVKEYHD